jgi:hypothetical protein
MAISARITPGLRKWPVDAGAARSGDNGKDAVEHLPPIKILIEPERAASLKPQSRDNYSEATGS